MYTTNDANYINQLKYGADEILKLVNILLRRNPQPVIIIQADEGPFPDRYRLDELTFDWREATDDEFRQKFGIPTAYYFPDRDYAALHPRITPVNTFRILFSKYFGADLPPLADKSYSITSDNDLYSLFEITDKFRTHDGDKLNP
ncbi:MAG: hypothetical protein E2O92_09615 [Alphaproteobacteria bacterium]|nr:MAG: hypothetical protein E2O92_09615 [Alphaproteobacteria bacterium]